MYNIIYILHNKIIIYLKNEDEPIDPKHVVRRGNNNDILAHSISTTYWKPHMYVIGEGTRLSSAGTEYTISEFLKNGYLLVLFLLTLQNLK